MTCAETIKNLRKEKKMTQTDLANILNSKFGLNVDRAMVSKWETGFQKPQMYRVLCIAKIFDVSPEYVMGDDYSAESDVQPLTLAPGDIYNIPIYENVSAGFGAAAVDSVIDHIPLPFKSKFEAEQTICIKVQGDSMAPKIEDGDLIQVHRQTSVDSGDIAVVILDGDNGLVKKVEYTEDVITLISLNLNYPPITLKGADIQRVEVVGKVKKIIREI